MLGALDFEFADLEIGFVQVGRSDVQRIFEVGDTVVRLY